MKLNKKCLYAGFSLAIVHLILMVPLSIYFGLGMDRGGTWFMQNFYMQPGRIMVNLLSNSILKSKVAIIFYLTNFIFYSTIGYILSVIIVKTKVANGEIGNKTFRGHR